MDLKNQEYIIEESPLKKAELEDEELLCNFHKLNSDGKVKALDNIKDLTYINLYKANE